MFGFVIANKEELSPEEEEIYRGYYCGLCRELSALAGFKGRLTLNFDMTFLALFLSAYYRLPEEMHTEKCVAHPIKVHPFITNRFTEYAAQMNLLLSYFKFDDDWKDDRSLKALTAKNSLQKTVERIHRQYPQKTAHIQAYLNDLTRIEASGEHNPDIPANCFGRLMAQLFDVEGDCPALAEFGFRLGKVIYIMDACVDLKKDVKKCRYNPMIEVSSQDFQQILKILLSDCTDIYDTMIIIQNKGIIENILFSGIWTRFRKEGK